MVLKIEVFTLNGLGSRWYTPKGGYTNYILPVSIVDLIRPTISTIPTAYYTHRLAALYCS